jgi:hypothetical protein
MSTDRTLDWIPRFDERSRDFPVRAVTAGRKRPEAVWWGPPKERIDQGSEGACVGFAWTNELLAQPVVVKLPQEANTFARNLYRSAQKIDEWEGENYSGTSVLAGAKVAQLGGYITGYRWAFSIDEVLDALAFLGPVVLGVPWLESMYGTLPGGLVKVAGKQVGGHAILATGFGMKSFPGGQNTWRNKNPEFVVRWRNSWGSSYGVKGDGFIRVSDLATLLKVGEACVPLGRM